ncbi:MAG TPA: ABC transporter ATP-binding protein [Opitutaceae bacterium]|jgi:ABC-2 type transport system ATP-binding protein
MNTIETRNLSHRYGRTEVLHDLTLEVPEGRVFALLGANGAGKTTAIKVLMNLLRPSAGSARVLGVDSVRLGPAELGRIGYVSENQEMPGWMTVRGLLDYCRPFYPTWDRGLESRLLREFELPEWRRIRDLSRGMAMKAALLSSLAYRPRLLVLDEPFSGLDALAREEFVHGILEVAGFGEWTVFVSSHDIEEVERLADTVALLDSGRLSFAESTDSLLGRFRRIEAVTPSGDPRPPPGMLEWSREGARVRYVVGDYSADQLGRWAGEQGPGASAEAVPMTLREIFIALARKSRSRAKEAAL